MLPEGFLAFINEHRLFTPANRVLLAVSGGIDSVVLAALFREAGFPFGIAHVNFGLRGAESDADEAFVENMAQAYGVPFHHTRFDTRAEARSRGESTQVAARQLRYQWFADLQTQYEYASVATAHHLNDVLETLLLNLTRGTGLAGLRGMPIQTEPTAHRPRLVRPLWFAPRAAIDAYAQARGLAWRDDSSNATDHYSRNRIRHQVVPVLEQINPGLLHALPRSLTQLRAAEALLRQELTHSFQQCTQPTSNGFKLDVARLSDLSEPLFRLGEWLRPYGFTPDVLAQCWQAVGPSASLSTTSGQVFLAPAHRLLHDRGTLWLQPHPATPAPPITLTGWPAASLAVGTDSILTADQLAFTDWNGQWPADASTALLNADALPFPWTLRRWQTGDRFKPLGMTGSRLLSDLLADLKIPLPQRERVWVLESNQQIVWVPGVRVGQVARLGPNTTQLARLHWHPL